MYVCVAASFQRSGYYILPNYNVVIITGISRKNSQRHHFIIVEGGTNENIFS